MCILFEIQIALHGLIWFPCRKICKHCRCSREDHDLHGNESDDGQPIGMLLDSIPRPTGSVHYETLIPSPLNSVSSTATPDCRLDGNSGTAYVDDPRTLTDIYGSETDVVLSRVISENIVSITITLKLSIH